MGKPGPAHSSAFAGRVQAGPIGRRAGRTAKVDGPDILRHAKGMLIKAVLGLHRAALLAALTVALLAMGVAQRLSAPQDEASASVLADGVSLADICGGDPGGANHRSADCLGRQIAGTANLPPVANVVVDLEPACHAAVVVARGRRAPTRVLDPANRPQGPPIA